MSKIIDAHIPLRSVFQEGFHQKYPNHINYKLYDPDNNDEIYGHEISLSPDEALLIGIRLIEAAIPLIAEDQWDDLRRTIKGN